MKSESYPFLKKMKDNQINLAKIYGFLIINNEMFMISYGGQEGSHSLLKD